MIEINEAFTAEWTTFSAGEEQCTITQGGRFAESPVITCDWTSATDTMRILLMKNALDNMGLGDDVRLILPYLPYSRQDRVTEPGAAFALKCFATQINSCNFKEIETWDAHSNVAELLINNLKNIGQTEFLRTILAANPQIDCIIAPDAGAYKKVYETCSALPEDLKEDLIVICAQKHRDVATGDITEMTIDTKAIKAKDCLVLDDICDGGRTFIELAKACRSKQHSIQLAVTHGIFSNGMEDLDRRYDEIHVLNSMELVEEEII